MAPRQKPYSPDIIDDLYTRINTLEDVVRRLQRTPTYVERVNPVTLPDPVEGQVAIDSRTNCFIYYSNGAWREKCSAVHAIKINSDTKTNAIKDGAFRFTVEKDLANTVIEQVEAFNGIEGTGLTSIQIRNVTRGINILNTVQSVPSGEWHSNSDADINDGGNVNDPNNMVHYKDRIWVNLTAVGAGSKGAGAYITFHGPKVDLTF